MQQGGKDWFMHVLFIPSLFILNIQTIIKFFSVRYDLELTQITITDFSIMCCKLIILLINYFNLHPQYCHPPFGITSQRSSPIPSPLHI